MDNMERDEVTEQEYDDPMVDYYYEQSKRQSLVRTHPEWFEDNVQSIRSWGFAESRVIMLADVVDDARRGGVRGGE